MVHCSFSTVRERDMDLLFLEAFASDTEFVQLVLEETTYAGKKISVIDTQLSRTELDLGESDITVILEIEGKRIALLIEDKIDAIAMPNQYGRYKLRGQKGIEKGEWQAFEIFIFCPEKYLQPNTESEKYDHHIFYTEFGKNLGSGSTFSLTNYYELCDLIVEALQEHPTLLDKHAALLEEKHYKTPGKPDCLHLLAFDIIYCSSAYHSFTGLTHKPKAEVIRENEEEEKKQKEKAERLVKIAAKEEEILQLECELDVYRAISLVGIQVTDKKYGVGTVIHHNVDNIHVSFGEFQCNYTLSTQYIWRPRFEDDTQLISTMMEYAAKIKKMEKLQKELQEL